MRQDRPPIHGRDHAAGGADPIPGMTGGGCCGTGILYLQGVDDGFVADPDVALVTFTIPNDYTYFRPETIYWVFGDTHGSLNPVVCYRDTDDNIIAVTYADADPDSGMEVEVTFGRGLTEVGGFNRATDDQMIQSHLPFTHLIPGDKIQVIGVQSSGPPESPDGTQSISDVAIHGRYV